jgi:membrane-associated phospholipid phosphatase
VHYPSDVLGGMIIGIIVGLFFVYLWNIINKKLKILKN